MANDKTPPKRPPRQERVKRALTDGLSLTDRQTDRRINLGWAGNSIQSQVLCRYCMVGYLNGLLGN